MKIKFILAQPRSKTRLSCFGRNSFILTVAFAILIALLVNIALAISGGRTNAADKLSKGDAEKLIRRFAGGDLGGDNVSIVGEVSALGSSATAVAQIETAFRFERAKGKWRVAEVRTGDNRWESIALLTRALDEQKRLHAQAELETIRTALESYRRERGFYVVAADERTLIDALAPRFLREIIRVDPWHRPYQYQGTTTNFTLSSDGADGEADTTDDIKLSGSR